MSIKYRGFASIAKNKQRLIAGRGGKSAHAQGKAHKWTPEEAGIAGRLGGRKPRRTTGIYNMSPATRRSQLLKLLQDTSASRQTGILCDPGERIGLLTSAYSHTLSSIKTRLSSPATSHTGFGRERLKNRFYASWNSLNIA